MCCRAASQHSCQLIFENVSFLRRFGLARSQVEYSNMWKQMSEADQQAKWSFVTEILQVSLHCLKREGPAAISAVLGDEQTQMPTTRV